MLKKKSDALEAFRHFKALVEVCFNSKIQQLQSDNGGEFIYFTKFLSECGIQHRFSCPHTSEQNGMVEHKHRQIVEVGLTLLAHASLPLFYWPDAFTTAVFLINRLTTKVLGDFSPFQKLYGIKPDYSLLKIFGCQCFPCLQAYNSHKLEYHSTPCLFLGYSSLHKGYKCLGPTTGRLYISRHVIFHEHVLPSLVRPNVRSTSKIPFHTSPSSLQPTHSSSTITQPSVLANPSSTPTISSPIISVSPQLPVEPIPLSLPNSSPPSSLPYLPQNTHPMTTRAKSGIFKPKIFMVNADDAVPLSVNEALAHPEWAQAVHDEYDALLRFQT